MPMYKGRQDRYIHQLEVSEEGFSAGTLDLSGMINAAYRISDAVILLCNRGRVKISVNLKEIEIKPRCMLLLFPRDVITAVNEDVGKDLDIDFFAFSHVIFDRIALNLEPRFFPFLRQETVFHIPEDNYPSMQLYMKYMKRLYLDKGNRFRKEIVASQLQVFFLEIFDKTYDTFVRTSLKNDSRQKEIFTEFISLIHKHCHKERRVTFYADALCISTRYLSSISREISNYSAKQLIDMFTAQEIKVLLNTTKLSVQEIADMLNFPDQSYLGRFFKQKTGKSPREYRDETE